MALDYSVHLSAKDDLSGTIKQCKQAVQDFGTAATGAMDKFTQRFQRIEQSSAPLKRQLRDLKALMAEMNFKGLSNTEEFTRIAQYAGQVKDAMDDAGAAARRFADDTFALQATIGAFQAMTGAATALTGAMNLFGVKNEEVKNAILKVQSAMAVLNGLQAVANALNKDSALMQALKAMKMRYTTEMTRLNSLETNKNTLSEVANKAATDADAVSKTKAAIATGVESAATKKGTIAQNAWNVAKATAKALLGDFTGLALVAAGAITTMALATAGSTDEIEGQTEALKGNSKELDANTIWKERMKKSEQEWSDAVTQNASNQIAQYTKLQLKWLECNKDQKLREKFQREYGEEVNRVAGKVLKLTEYEDFFVNNTDKVVDAILARAAAEASAQKYAEAVLKKAENDRNGTRANGRYWTVYHEGEVIDKDEAAKLGFKEGRGYKIEAYTGTNVTYYVLDEYGAKRKTELAEERADKIKAQDDEEIEFWKNDATKRAKELKEKQEAAGMGSGYKPPKAWSSGGGGSHGSRGSSSGGKKPEEEVKPLAQSLEWLRQQLQETQKQLSYGLIPANKIEETKTKIKNLKEEIEQKEIELGFKVVPADNSLDWMQQQLNELRKNIDMGLIPDDQLEEEIHKVEQWKDKINEKKIQLGIEPPPETDYEKSEKQRESDLKEYKDYLRNITRYAKDYEQFARNQKALKEYQEYLARLDADEEELSFSTDKASESTDRFREACNKLNEQLESGAITRKEYEQQIDDLLTNQQFELDKVVVAAPVKLKEPKVFDLGNIAQHYEDALAEIDKMLNEDDLTIDARIRLNETKQSLQEKLNDITKGEFVIKAVVEPQYYKKGTADWLSENYKNASQQIQKIQEQYEQGIIKTSAEARQKIAEVNAELLKLGLKPIEIEIKTKGQEALENAQKYLGQFNDVVVGTVDSIDTLVKSIDEGASGWEIFKNAISTAEQIMSSIGSVMQTINALTQAHTAATMANAAATTADAAASTGNAAAKTAEAGATAGVAVAETAAQNAKMGPWGWVAAIAGAVALAAVLFATIGKFANGGIIGGHSYSGDKLIARVNSGEMILNQRQQRNLFNAINRGDIGGNNTQSVTWRIKGSDLYGTLRNYQKIKGKSSAI